MPAEVREIVKDYVLLVFDIPQSQPKLRKLVLRRIHDLGGLMHTMSVYLLPYSDETFALANTISSDGEVVVWRSHQEDEKKAEALTIQYDQHVKQRCTLIEMRLAQIKDHIENGRLGKANRMIQKTVKMLNQVKEIAKTFCPKWLPGEIAELETGIKQIHD